jgi:hypothetical protein
VSEKARGSLVVAASSSCIDSSTGLSLGIPLSAPMEAAVISPITSLLQPNHAGVMAQAERVRLAMRLD